MSNKKGAKEKGPRFYTLRAIFKKARSVIKMCGPNPDEPWECEKCIAKMQEHPKARLCWDCYEFGKANADLIIRDTWAWGEDLEPYADEMKRDFLKDLEEYRPYLLRAH